MFGGLVWLFQEHRDLYMAYQELLRASGAQTRSLEDMAAKLAEAQARPPMPPEDFEKIVRQFNNEALVDLPYEGGAIPNDAWLTPGRDDPREKVESS